MHWRLKDYVFAAFMTIGMVIAVLVTAPVPTVIPGLRVVVWAPFAGIFLTLGMARLQRRGSIALIILPLALLMGLISPIITLYLSVTILLTELVSFFRQGNYRSKSNRLLGNITFFSSATLIGLLIGAYTLGGVFAQVLTQPWILVLMTGLSGVTGTLGWWLGELVIKQLRQAGKIDADL